jgi:ABC-type Fe3+-hydroxamate transport system substrate-binding protein
VRQSFRPVLALLALSLLLAACASAATPQPAAIVEPSADSIIVRDSLGEVILPAPAARVIALEWTYVEDLLALGIQPVGIADVEGFLAWVKLPVELSPDVVDVGLRGEPNMETIAALDPDLIIEISYSAEAYLDKLQAIAPTLVFNPYPTDETISTFDEMRSTLLEIGTATGRRAAAEAALSSLDAKIESGRTAIQDAGLTGEKFVLSQLMSWENAQYLRFFTDNGMAVEIVEKLGLENGWADSAFQQYGFTDVGTEALVTLPNDVHFFYVLQDDDPIQTISSFQEVWQSLPYVAAGHAYPLGGDTWLFGGPLSAELLVDIVVEAFTGQPLD